MKRTAIKCGKMRPEVTKEKIIDLAASIKKNTLIYPIIINSKNKVIEGRTRYAALTYLEINEFIEGEHYVVKDGNDLGIELIGNLHRTEIALGTRLKQIKQLVKTETIERTAEILGESVIEIRRKLNLQKLSPQFKEALKENLLPEFTLDHFEYVASFSITDQDMIFEMNNLDSDIKEFKKEIIENLTVELSTLPWEETGCGKCSFCKQRNSVDLLFPELSENSLCSDHNYIKKKTKEWKDSVKDRVLITPRYYSEDRDVVNKDNYTEGGDVKAIFVDGERMGEKILITTDKSNCGAKKTKAQLEDQLFRKRLNWIAINKIIPELEKFKPEAMNLALVYGLFASEGVLSEWTKVRKMSKEEKTNKIWEQVKVKLERDFSLRDEIYVKSGLAFLGLNFDTEFATAIIKVPEPQSWSKK